MNWFKKIITPVAIISTVFAGSMPLSYADEARGLEIAKERKQRNIGWETSVSDMTMILRSASKKESLRKMNISTLEVADDGDKGLTVFEQPADVRGTRFLSHSHTVGSDDQWLYLPALKRVKRIASRNKSGPFMGSEFAYEDMSSFELEKYKFNYLRDEVCGNNLTCFVVEQFPTDKNSGYTRQIVWVDQTEYRVMKTEFYDRKDSLLKTLVNSNFEQYLGQYWRPNSLKMVNHQSGKSTDLIVEDLEFKVELTDKDFDKNRLARN